MPVLLAVTGGVPAAITVAIEVPHGPVVENLLERGFSVHSINPKQLDGFRNRFAVAGAKDDRRDAQVLADALRTDGHCFRALRVADPVVIERLAVAPGTTEAAVAHARRRLRRPAAAAARLLVAMDVVRTAVTLLLPLVGRVWHRSTC